MHTLRFTLLIVSALNASGQLWSLFPFNQCSYFEVTFSDGSKKIEEITNDSIFSDEERNQFFFNTRYNTKECFNGDIMLKGDVNENRIDIGSLSPGVYILQLFSNKGLYRTKILKTVH